MYNSSQATRKHFYRESEIHMYSLICGRHISLPFSMKTSWKRGLRLFPLSPLPHLFNIAGTVAGLLLLLGSYRLQNSRVFFSKTVKKSVKRGVRVLRSRGVRGLKCEAKGNLSPVSLSVVSLVPDLLFDCSRVLEYAKIRTVLQSRGAMNGVHSASVILDYPTSGVPQNVDVVPEGSIPSLQRPKSVKTTWPCKKLTHVENGSCCLQRSYKLVFLQLLVRHFFQVVYLH